MKICKICKVPKDESAFEKNRRVCLCCRYKQVPKAVLLRKKNKQRAAHQANPEIKNSRKRLDYSLNKEKYKIRNKIYWQEHGNKYQKERLINDPQFKISKNLRTRINHALNGNLKSEPTLKLLGCTIEFLKSHLESKFRPGMTWENHTKFGWHIDHIRPCASFDLTIPKEQQKCFHYSNLQPFWAKDNLSKGSKILNRPLLESPPSDTTQDTKAVQTISS
jgi:hypothetical protein